MEVSASKQSVSETASQPASQWTTCHASNVKGRGNSIINYFGVVFCVIYWNKVVKLYLEYKVVIILYFLFKFVKDLTLLSLDLKLLFVGVALYIYFINIYTSIGLHWIWWRNKEPWHNKIIFGGKFWFIFFWEFCFVIEFLMNFTLIKSVF